MNKDDANSQTNVVKSVEDEDDVFLATNDEVAKTKWMMDSAVSKHICRDRDMFDTLKIDGEFSHFKYYMDTFSVYNDLTEGRYGRGFLFSHAMNIVVGPKEDRHLMTGLHTVADVYCGDCREVLGWKYERAYEASQKYKEGKFILEKSKIVKENW
eukprot:XP_014622349.1 protein yippee-like At3g08990 [Glycine max]